MAEVIPFESAHSLSDLSYFEEIIELSSGDEVLLTEKSTVRKEPRIPPQSSQWKRKDGFHKSFSEESVDFIEVECSDDEYMIEEVVEADQEEEFTEEYIDDEDEWHSQLAGESDEDRANEISNRNGHASSATPATRRNSKLKNSQHPSEADDESSLGDSCGSFNDSSTAFNPDDPRPPIPTQEELYKKCPSFQSLSDSSLDAQEAFELQLPQSAHRRKSRQMSALTCDWDTLRDELDDMQDYASSVDDMASSHHESRRSLGEDGSNSGRDFGDKSPSLLKRNGVVITMDKRLLSGGGSSGHKRGPLGRTHSGGLRRTNSHIGVPGGAGGPSDLETLKEDREDASQGGDFSTVHEADTSGGNASSLRVPMLPPFDPTPPPKPEVEKEEAPAVSVGTNGKAISTNNKYDYDDFSDASTSDSVDDDEGFLPESVRATTKIQSFAPMVRKETNESSMLPSRLLHSPDSKLSSVSYHESNTGASLLPPIGRRPRRSSLDNIGMSEALRPLSPHSSTHASHTDSVDSPKSVSLRFDGSNHSAPEPRLRDGASPRVRLRSKRRMSTGYPRSLSHHGSSSTGIAIGGKERRQLRLQPQALEINSSSQPSLKAHRRKLSRFGDLLQRSSALDT